MSEASGQPLSSKIATTFRQDVVKEVLKSKFQNPKNKITEDAVELVAEIAKVMVVEAAARAAQQASSENKKRVGLEHAEAILPQMMLDFP
ncbi:hypothetical protein NQ318_017536 [Aromia moschata]|uniref:Centromere protein X n=1 Tax=Aromia moschata TaxID=1265417 RepID=A0AAV8Z3B8_9CUCU|nr:hypothetical protein NQ318_017536 [Aromia moschata]